MSAHALTASDISAKKKKYLNVFYGLIVLTVVELLIVKCGQWYPSISHLVIVLGVVLFSCAKAVVVGYYFMHLEHETKMLKFVSCLPILAFMYAFFLVVDVKDFRHMSTDLFPAARVHAPEMMDRARLGEIHAPGKEGHGESGGGHEATVEGHGAHSESAPSAGAIEINVGPGKKFVDPNAPEGRYVEPPKAAEAPVPSPAKPAEAAPKK